VGMVGNNGFNFQVGKKVNKKKGNEQICSIPLSILYQF
jgi:hypothetical protein